jgi:hypothetical protein
VTTSRKAVMCLQSLLMPVMTKFNHKIPGVLDISNLIQGSVGTFVVRVAAVTTKDGINVGLMG